MRRSAPGAIAAATLICAFVVCAFVLPTLAAGDGETPALVPSRVEKTFLIPSSDGYGVGDCLSGPDSACGRVVADAWCEAQGYATAAAYGIAAADDYTGAIDLPVAKPAERPIRITCRD